MWRSGRKPQGRCELTGNIWLLMPKSLYCCQYEKTSSVFGMGGVTTASWFFENILKEDPAALFFFYIDVSNVGIIMIFLTNRDSDYSSLICLPIIFMFS